MITRADTKTDFKPRAGAKPNTHKTQAITKHCLHADDWKLHTNSATLDTCLAQGESFGAAAQIEHAPTARSNSQKTPQSIAINQNQKRDTEHTHTHTNKHAKAFTEASAK